MKTEDISQNTIRELLLGRLDEPTTDRLDELSITDPSFADQLALEQYELIDDWVAGRLDPGEKRAFEEVLSRSPTLRERADFAVTLRRAGTVTQPGKRFRAHREWFGRFPRFAFGVAGFAALIAVFAGLAFFFRSGSQPELSATLSPNPEVTEPSNQLPPQPPTVSETPDVERVGADTLAKQPSPAPSRQIPVKSPPRSVTSVALALLPPTRGAGQIRSVSVASGIEYLDLSVQTEADSSGPFRVEISDASTGNVVWKSGAIRSGSGGGRTSVNVRIPVKRVCSGVRTVRLLRSDDGSTVDEHVIRVEC